MGAGRDQNVLETFKCKISECIGMVGLMGADDRISAVEYWNSVSEQLQKVIDNSVEDQELGRLSPRESAVVLEGQSFADDRGTETDYNIIVSTEPQPIELSGVLHGDKPGQSVLISSLKEIGGTTTAHSSLLINNSQSSLLTTNAKSSLLATNVQASLLTTNVHSSILTTNSSLPATSAMSSLLHTNAKSSLLATSAQSSLLLSKSPMFAVCDKPDNSRKPPVLQANGQIYTSVQPSVRVKESSETVASVMGVESGRSSLLVPGGLTDSPTNQRSVLLGSGRIVSPPDQASVLLSSGGTPDQASVLLSSGSVGGTPDQASVPLSSDRVGINTDQASTLISSDRDVSPSDQASVLLLPETCDLSGQVLIVGECEKDNQLDTIIEEEQVGEDDPVRVGKEITVTGSDGVEHKIQFQVEEEHSGNEEEEGVMMMDQNDDGSEEVTADMAAVDTVTIDSNPAPVDESSHRVMRASKGGVLEAAFQCEICNKVFSTAASLTSHRWQHTKPFQCEHCRQRFASKGNLVIHRRRHTGEKPYGCNLCDSKFSTKGNLKRHVQTHSGIKPWACNQCEGRFTEKKSLKIHMRKHTGERPYACRVCGKRFAQTSILRSHLAMHLDKRAHLCDLCGRSFRQKSQLRLHVQRHTGIKKFDCIYCESKFLTKGDLERHVKSHLGTRDFSCELCSKTFTRQQTLNEHMNRHYGLRPYECKVCGKSFSEMSTVYKHLRSHAKDKELIISEKLTEEHIIIHDIPELSNIVHYTVDDQELSEGLLEDVVIDMKLAEVNESNAVQAKEQFIYLETTEVDGSVSITEATVDLQGNLKIEQDGLLQS